ncbi:zf-CCHC domain-containing protein [Tanacetum coccineum]
MIIKKDSEIVKAKVERKSIALKAKKESSDEVCSTSDSEDEEYSMATFQRSRDDKNGKSDRKCFRCGDPNHLIGECPKPPKDKNQRAFVEGSWSDSGEEDDEKVKHETCRVAHSSSEVCSESSYFSDENSSIDDLALDNEYDKLWKMSLKIITKNKRLKAIKNSLENELRELKDKLSTLEKNKGVDLDCEKCHTLKIANEKIKEESTRLNKFEKRGNVIFGSNLCGNIIGKGQICDNKCRVTFSKRDSEITKDGKVIEPKNVNEALGDESWIVAMQEELNQFVANDIGESSSTSLGRVTSKETKWFEMSMMDELNLFLGLQIKQMEDGIFFNQSKYIKEMLKKFGLEDSKPMKTPMSSDTKLTKDEECTTHLGLWYPKGTDIETVIYADSDHVEDYMDQKSTSGICRFMGYCLTSWFSKKQTALAISTTEAEYGDFQSISSVLSRTFGFQEYRHFEAITRLLDHRVVDKRDSLIKNLLRSRPGMRVLGSNSRCFLFLPKVIERIYSGSGRFDLILSSLGDVLSFSYLILREFIKSCTTLFFFFGMISLSLSHSVTPKSPKLKGLWTSNFLLSMPLNTVIATGLVSAASGPSILFKSLLSEFS